MYNSVWGPLVNTKFLMFSGLSLVIVWLSTHSYLTISTGNTLTNYPLLSQYLKNGVGGGEGAKE